MISCAAAGSRDEPLPDHGIGMKAVKEYFSAAEPAMLHELLDRLHTIWSADVVASDG